MTAGLLTDELVDIVRAGGLRRSHGVVKRLTTRLQGEPAVTVTKRFPEINSRGRGLVGLGNKEQSFRSVLTSGSRYDVIEQFRAGF